jgi:NADH-quinone oxidoreductase subunit E
MTSSFEFTAENQAKIGEIVKRYPQKRAALLPLLHLAHDQQGFISPEVESRVAQILEIPEVDVHEVVTFYTLYFRKPMGRHHIRLCNSISCWVRHSDEIKEYLEQKLGVAPDGITADARFSWEAVPDCLGACEQAPMMQVDGCYHGNLTPEKVDELLDNIDSDTR